MQLPTLIIIIDYEDQRVPNIKELRTTIIYQIILILTLRRWQITAATLR